MGNTCADNGSLASCCEEKLVEGGMFPMGRSESGTDAYSFGNSDEQPEHDSTVADFYLDTFEVTVGRFRQFVAHYDGTPPVEGAAAHPLIAGSGWQTAWNNYLPSSKAKLVYRLKCSPSSSTWTDTPGAHETYPINCVSWYVAFAFCAWEGGRLPTEAEWEYAAAGGSENRAYPWGQQAPSAAYANFVATDNSPFIDVGAHSAGAGRWGHQDLAGSIWERVLDRYDANWYGGAGATCSNCANLDGDSARGLRGGSWWDPASSQRVVNRNFGTDGTPTAGIRCASTP